LAFDKAGNLYVANEGNNTIERFTPDGTGAVFANSGLNEPMFLAFDGAENLYVGNAGASGISEVAPDGQVLAFSTGAFYVAPDLAGNIYTATGSYAPQSDSILRLSQDGTYSTFATVPDQEIGGVYYGIGDFVVTPEPATLSLLALGGLAVLRRRKQPRTTVAPAKPLQSCTFRS
jgi:hypothetical protein